MKPKAIVFDLDWTLCELKPESDRNNHTGNEEPIESIIYLAKSIMKIDNIKVLILTGRKEKYLHETIHWLVKQDIPAEIVMQTKSQADKNHVFKREQLKKMQEKYDILAVIDDNELVWDVCLELWILFLQVKTCKK